MVIVVQVLIVIFLLLIVIMVADGNRFRVVHYQLNSNKIKKSHTFVVLADLHNKTYGKNHEKLLKKIEKQMPEAILIAGDILTAKPGYSTRAAVDLIRQLSEKYPVYYGMGNHETRLFYTLRCMGIWGRTIAKGWRSWEYV